MAERIELSELLKHISDQLVDAHEHAQKRGRAVMQFKECEIEFAIEVKKEATGTFKVWVMSLGGGIKKTESNTIKVKFASIGRFPIVAEEFLRPVDKG